MGGTLRRRYTQRGMHLRTGLSDRLQRLLHRILLGTMIAGATMLMERALQQFLEKGQTAPGARAPQKKEGLLARAAAEIEHQPSRKGAS